MRRTPGRQNRRRPKNRHVLAGVIALVAAMVFAGMGFEAWQTDRRLEAAPIAEAVIAEVHDGFGSNDYLAVDFETAFGQQVHAQLVEGYWSPYPRVGDVITIRYDPSEPTELLRDVRRGDDRGLVVVAPAQRSCSCCWPSAALLGAYRSGSSTTTDARRGHEDRSVRQVTTSKPS